MRYSAILPILLFSVTSLFGQFKNTFAPNGNPTTQIIDASGMKQGNWYYYDTHNQVYRTETFADHVLLKSTYSANGLVIDLRSYRLLSLQDLKAELAEAIRKTLQPFGSGELIVSQDGAMYLHYYIDKAKGTVPSNLNIEPLRKQVPASSIIQF